MIFLLSISSLPSMEERSILPGVKSTQDFHLQGSRVEMIDIGFFNYECNLTATNKASITINLEEKLHVLSDAAHPLYCIHLDQPQGDGVALYHHPGEPF